MVKVPSIKKQNKYSLRAQGIHFSLKNKYLKDPLILVSFSPLLAKFLNRDPH
jgi:hypothetical protein